MTILEQRSRLSFIKHLLSSCRSFSSSLALSVSSLPQPLWSIKKFAEIKEKVKIDASTLILLDIDNTLLAPLGDCGTVEHFTHLYKAEMVLKRCSEIEAKIAIHERWINVHSFIQMKLVDEKIHEFMMFVKKEKAISLGFTARLPRMKEVTLHHLRQHKLAFNDLEGLLFKKVYQIFPPSFLSSGLQQGSSAPRTIGSFDKKMRMAQSLFASGIVFCHDLNEKGTVLSDFFSILKNYCHQKGLPPIKKIIFVDDGAYNFPSMYKAALSHDLEFYGFHFQFENNFDALRAEQEEHHFLSQQIKLVS